MLGVGIGRTDLICLDTEDNYVVLELKVDPSSDSVVGELLRYMGYVRENGAEKAGKKVRGIILTPAYDELCGSQRRKQVSECSGFGFYNPQYERHISTRLPMNVGTGGPPRCLEAAI